MLPYSSMFILGSTNPSVTLLGYFKVQIVFDNARTVLSIATISIIITNLIILIRNVHHHRNLFHQNPKVLPLRGELAILRPVHYDRHLCLKHRFGSRRPCPRALDEKWNPQLFWFRIHRSLHSGDDFEGGRIGFSETRDMSACLIDMDLMYNVQCNTLLCSVRVIISYTTHVMSFIWFAMSLVTVVHMWKCYIKFQIIKYFFQKQVINQGVLFHPGSYCRDLWNILDATVVICALVAFAFSLVQLSLLR